MAEELRPLNDDEILSICLAEIDSASGFAHGELAEQRANAMDRYNGEPYGDEVAGRSEIRTREVLETVEGLLPSIMRVLMETDNLIQFMPTGLEDEELAEQETEMVRRVFWTKNRGFYNLYTFVKDALLSKTGVLKCWADETPETEHEKYKGLTNTQLGELFAERGVEREVLEFEATEEGTDVVFKTTWDNVNIRILPIPPEEFGVERDARSPYIEDLKFCYCRYRKTLAELVEAGYERDFLMTLPSNDDIETEERLARRNLDDEQESLDWANDPSMRVIWVTECFVRIDREAMGSAQLLKVTIAAGAYTGAGGRLMDIEEIDSHMLFATPVNLITHKFHGMSIADLVVDIQEIETVLTRQSLDNTYMANNGMTAVNKDKVHLEDLLTRRPGGIVRFKGDQPWSAVVGPIPHNPLPPQTGELLERLDERIKRRTGYGAEVGALDGAALGQVNTGVAALYFDVMRTKISQIAQIITEVGLKPLFEHIHELLIKTNYAEQAMSIRGEWVHVNPSEWKTKRDTEVQVGLGKVSRETKIMGMQAMYDRQTALVEKGAMDVLVKPQHMWEANKQWAKAWGFQPEQFFQDPSLLPPPEPKQPGPQDKLIEAQAQALTMDGQSKMMRAQVAGMEAQAARERNQQEMQYKRAEQGMKGQIAQLKTGLDRMRAETDAESKVLDLRQERDMARNTDTIKLLELRLETMNGERDRQIDAYKIQMDGFLKMMQAYGMDTEAPVRLEAERTEMTEQRNTERLQDTQLAEVLHMNLVKLSERIADMDRKAEEPRTIEYDAKGLMSVIGGKNVTRDESGRAIQLG